MKGEDNEQQLLSEERYSKSLQPWLSLVTFFFFFFLLVNEPFKSDDKASVIMRFGLLCVLSF